VILAQLFCKREIGDGGLLEIADAVKTAFGDGAVSGLRFGAVYWYRVTNVKGPYQLNVVVPFSVDD
jgi:hypothetical protein